MTSHGAIVHSALQNCKRLSHYELNYSLRMNEPYERLRRARIDAGFETARAAAESMGISEFTYNNHENGARGLTSKSAQRYARKFKISEEWLLFGKGDGPGTESNGRPVAEIIDMVRRATPMQRRQIATIVSALVDGATGTGEG